MRKHRKHCYKTYLAGPMQAVAHSGAGWRVVLGRILSKRFGVEVQDPVQDERKKTRRSATGTKNLLKTLTSLLVRGDKDAERKFLKLLRKVIELDFKAIRASRFIVALVIEGIVSSGTNEEIIYASKKKIPIYILYLGRIENFPAWMLYRILRSGGRVFPVKDVKKPRDFNDLIEYLKRRFELEKLEW